MVCAGQEQNSATKLFGVARTRLVVLGHQIYSGYDFSILFYTLLLQLQVNSPRCALDA